MKETNNFKQDVWKIILIGAIIYLVIFTLLIFSMFNNKISAEGNCRISNLSFKINDTGDLKDFSVNNGEAECKFKGESPIFIFGLK